MHPIVRKIKNQLFTMAIGLRKITGREPPFNPLEFFACIASRTIQDNTSVFVGTGLPLVAAKLAQKLHAPNLVAVYEGGGIDPYPGQMPWSVCCPWTYYMGAGVLDMAEVFGHTRNGYIDVGIVSGAQVDVYGNLNSHCIGEWEEPKVRFSGSGGANDMASLCEHTIIMMRHERKRFVEKLDFLTSPGHLEGRGARKRAGLLGQGPKFVISSLCICDFDEETKKMRVLSLHPTVTPDMIRENTLFDIDISPEADITPLPTREEIRILRTEVDPNGIFIS